MSAGFCETLRKHDCLNNLINVTNNIFNYNLYLTFQIVYPADAAGQNGGDNLPDNTLTSTALSSSRTDGHFATANRSTFEPLTPDEFNGDIVPDVTNWTVENVHCYFMQCIPTVAEVMRRQEIDGHALLLLKRRDVMSLTGITMGASLKAYEHVRQLQTRINDVRNA